MGSERDTEEVEEFEEYEDFDEFDEPVREKKKRANWFEQMEGFLNWTVIPPDITNPFKPPLPDRVLLELAYNPAALRSMSNLRCLCDGYEVLMIKNLETPIFRTDHPCISSLGRGEIMDYIERSGIHEKINTELSKVRKQIVDEINTREIESEDRGTVKRKLRKKEKKPKWPKSSGGSGFRVIRA